MSSLNKVILIGRLTRDVEARTFNSGGKVAKMGLAVNDRKKNSQTGQWEDDPMFIDVEVFNRGESGKAADSAEAHLAKGSKVCVVGRLVLETWDDKATKAKRSKHKVIADHIVYLDHKQDGNGPKAGGGASPAPADNDGDDQTTGDDIPF